MNAAGLSKSVPIYLGEFNNDAGNEGKQSVSIVNGLFFGQMLGTLENAGVPMATWWLAYGNCDESGDYSKKLYGWQHFGSESALLRRPAQPVRRLRGYAADPRRHALSDGARDGALCKQHSRRVSKSARSSVPEGARHERSRLRLTRAPTDTSSCSSTTRSRRFHSRAREHAEQSRFAATLSVYGKTQYDKSKENRWVRTRRSTSLGNVGTTVPLDASAL